MPNLQEYLEPTRENLLDELARLDVIRQEDREDAAARGAISRLRRLHVQLVGRDPTREELEGRA